MLLKKTNSENLEAQQLAHDMRAPIQAIKMMMMANIEHTEKSRKLILNALSRLENLASSTLQTAGLAELCLIQHLMLLTEEECIRSKVEVVFESTEHQMLMSAQTLLKIERMVSILMANSSEAGASKITLTVEQTPYSIILTCVDDGKGMSEAVLQQLGKKGFSYGKKNGSGLGVSYIFQNIKEFNGSVSVQSVSGQGASFRIALPLKLINQTVAGTRHFE